MAIYIDSRLWEIILSKVQECSTEKAFYLVGSTLRGHMYVYEVFEFIYASRGKAHIVSEPAGRILLSLSLPIGTRILGTIHSHPFSPNTPIPSPIDVELSKEYEGEVMAVINPFGLATAIMCVDGDQYEVPIYVRKLERERPLVGVVEDMYYVVPLMMSDAERRVYIPRYVAQYVYRLYLMGRFEDGKIITPKFRWVWVRQIFDIPHRVFLGNLESQMIETLKRAPGAKIYEPEQSQREEGSA